MTEWEVVGVLVVLLGLVASVTAPMIKLNSTITRLTTQMEHFSESMEEFKTQYSEQLREFKGVHEDLYDKVDNHEHRITVLEEGGRPHE